jgi:ribonucleotide reductase beta subunit family protein with ferritin-like domain
VTEEYEKIKNDLLEFMKRQIATENQIVASLNQGVADIKNIPVKAVLKGISLDSVKHSELYGAAIKLLTDVAPAMNQENLDKQRALVEKHIEMEAELIAKLEKMLPSIENNKVKFLLNTIFNDEKKHHAMLKAILESIVRAETITEDEWWQTLWEGSPFHGAPGG